MKLAVVLVATAAATNGVRHRRQAEKDRDVAKRYSQLIDQMTHFNADFDERKYWTYGCHCLMLGDRPMSDMGHGAPLDALDVVCRAYKECQKCARQVHGDMCIGEFVKYGHRIAGGNSICRDDAGTCERALCECDKAFAMAHVGAKDVWTNDYHRFWSDPEFDSDSMCIPNGGGSTDPQCCNDSTQSGPFILYNALNKECCSDGSVENLGQC